MKPKFIFIGAFVTLCAFFFSCTNDAFEKTEFVENGKIDIPELNLSLKIEGGRFSFDDETAFMNAVNALKNHTNA